MMMMVKEKAREEKDRISKRNYWAAGFNLQLFYCCLSYLVDIKIAGKPERRSMKLNAALSSLPAGRQVSGKKLFHQSLTSISFFQLSSKVNFNHGSIYFSARPGYHQLPCNYF